MSTFHTFVCRKPEQGISWYKKKLRTLIFLSLCVCLSFFLLDEMSLNVRRHLRCHDLQEYDPRTLAALGLEDEPCITDYPGEVGEVVLDPDSEEALEEPTFPLIPENDDDSLFPAYETDDDKSVLSPESEGDPLILDEAEFNLMDSYEPEIYNADDAIANAIPDDENSVGYILYATECWPETDQSPTLGDPASELIYENEPVPANDLYEVCAITKGNVCEITEMAEISRQLGHTRKLIQLEELNQLSAAEMNYTMHAIIHPEAVECPIKGSSEEETSTFNSVKLHQSLNYKVDILGHPITVADVCDSGNKDHICQNIQTCGPEKFRDSTLFHLWTATPGHPIVVLMDYFTFFQKQLDQELDSLLADSYGKGLYVKTPPSVRYPNEEPGVDTGFMIIKPSLEEFENIKNAYINTPFDPTSGWNGEGTYGYDGCLGISSFLAYYFSKDNGYTELDRCTYAHSGDEYCLAQRSLEESKAAKIYDKICGNPRHCPYDHPQWNAQQKKLCVSLHQKYFSLRYDFENKYFNKRHKQERIGLFKRKSFLGYCKGPGKDGFLSLVGDVIPQPDWLTICPPLLDCGSGYVTKDCTCVEDPCLACPDRTYCQTYPHLMCIDCECGFCDMNGSRCCDFNDQNNCKSGPGDNNNCNMQFNFFPAFSGSGNVCGGVEISATAVPNGCGCKPNSSSPCTFNKDWNVDKCFVCTSQDLASGICPDCKTCIAQCPKGDCINTSVTADDFMSCLKRMNDDDCRASCHVQCSKA